MMISQVQQKGKRLKLDDFPCCQATVNIRVHRSTFEYQKSEAPVAKKREIRRDIFIPEHVEMKIARAALPFMEVIKIERIWKKMNKKEIETALRTQCPKINIKTRQSKLTRIMQWREFGMPMFYPIFRERLEEQLERKGCIKVRAPWL